jgi:hypothetical protein
MLYGGGTMLATDLKERLLRDPFEPFRIRSSSGKTYDITQPFLVALMKSKVFIAAPNSDRWDELSYLHIAALESLSLGRKSDRRRRAG